MRVRPVFLLLIVLAAGGAVRTIGIFHGSPDLIFHPDVAKQVLVADAVCRGEGDPRRLFGNDVVRSHYPYGVPSLMGLACRGLVAAGIVSSPPPASSSRALRWSWALVLRLAAAGAALAAIAAVVCGLAPAIGSGPALGIGAVLAVEPSSAELSHYAMNDVPMTAVLLAAWICCARGSARGARAASWAAAAGLLLGIGVGIKYQAAIGVLFAIAPGWRIARRDGVARLAAVAGAATLAAAAGLWLASPFLRANAAAWLAGLPAFLEWQTSILGRDLPLAAKSARNAAAVVDDTWRTGSILFVPGVLWAAWRCALPRRRNIDSRLLLGPVLLVAALLAAVVLGRDFVRGPDLLPIRQFAICLAGIGAAELATSRLRRAELGALTAALVVAFGTTSVRDSLALARPDTRVRAAGWLHENLPRAASVVRERYTLSPLRRDVSETRVRYLASDDLPKRIRAGEFAFVVASSLAHDRFRDPRSPLHDEEIARFYDELDHRLELEARFEDRRLLYAHPTIAIYRAGSGRTSGH